MGVVVSQTPSRTQTLTISSVHYTAPRG